MPDSKSLIKVVAIILGGGAGTRLYPLTADRSKPAVPVGGKYRLIDIPISNCINSGVKRMFVLTQFNSASLNAHIKNTYQFDSFSDGFVDVLAAEQTRGNLEWFQGTADAVRQCMVHVDTHDYDYLMILSGDQLYQMDLEDLVKSHVHSEAELTIATIPVDESDASGFGIMKVEENGRIESFVEKPQGHEEIVKWQSPVEEKYAKEGKHYLASMGIYVFSKPAIKRLFKEKPEATDFGKEIIPAAIEKKFHVGSYAFDGYWSDIGTICSFYEANIMLTDEVPRFNLFDNRQILYTRGRMLAPSKVFGTRFFRAVISEGCIIHAETINRSIIGLRARIGRNTIINDSIIMGNDYFQTMQEILDMTAGDDIPMGVGNYCHIDRAIIDKDARVGNHVIIKGGPHLEDHETDTYVVRDGIVVVKKGAIIPHDTRIGA